MNGSIQQTYIHRLYPLVRVDHYQNSMNEIMTVLLPCGIYEDWRGDFREDDILICISMEDTQK